MEFRVTRAVKYKEIKKAQIDNDFVLALMGEFAVKEDGQPFTQEEWGALTDELDFPQGIIDMFQQFQQALVPPTRRMP